MTKTPRTDEQLKLEAFFDGIGIVETVEVEFAQQLETELADARAEIERKDALIEQMRDALSLILEGAIHDFHYICQRRDNCLCWGCQKKRVKAALSAAERGDG